MAYLEIKLGAEVLTIPFLGRVDYVIGRLPGVDIQLRDMRVSRLHTQLFIDSCGHAFVRDLGSSGGTTLGNGKIPSRAIMPLQSGDRLKIGDARVTYFDEPARTDVQPMPCYSEPTGLIRTTLRDRPVLPLDRNKIGTGDPRKPAEYPPEVRPEMFGAAPAAPAMPAPAASAPPASSAPPAPSAPAPASSAPPAPSEPIVAPRPPTGGTPKKRRDSGIVRAPWEDTGSVPRKKERSTVRLNAPPVAEESSADIEGPTQRSASQTQQAAQAARRAPGPESPPPPPPPRSPRGAAYVPPRVLGMAPLPEDIEDEEEEPRTSMPTVRLDRPLPGVKVPPVEDAPPKFKMPTAKIDLNKPVPGSKRTRSASTRRVQPPPVPSPAPPPEPQYEEEPPVVDYEADVNPNVGIHEEHVSQGGDLDDVDFDSVLGTDSSYDIEVLPGEGEQEDYTQDDDEPGDGTEIAFNSEIAPPEDGMDLDELAGDPMLTPTPPPPPRTRNPKRRTDRLTSRTDDVTGDPLQRLMSSGHKTDFVPKPEKIGGDPQRTRRVQDAARGPGGETVQIPIEMLQGMRPTAGEHPTIKRPQSQDEDEIVDDSYDNLPEPRRGRDETSID